MRRRLTFILLLISFHVLRGQSDTVLLPLFEKKIRGIEKEAGTLDIVFDSLAIDLNSSGSIADLLMNTGAVNLRVNSPGNLSTVSFRGLNGVHSRISWHGLNLNSPSSGITDLSALRQSLFNSISFRSDAYPSSVLSIENNQDWDDKYVELLFGLESFEGRNYALSYHTGNSTFFSRTQFDYTKAENNYPYRNDTITGNSIQVRSNSQNRLWNLKQDVGFITQGRSTRNTHSIHLWLSGYERNLPGSILIPSPFANQTDNAVRFAYKWQLDQQDLKWTTVLGYLRDRLEYRDAFMDTLTGELVNVGSDYTQRRIHLNSSFKYKLEDYVFFGGIDLRTMNVSSSNYGVLTPETAIAFHGKAQKNWKRARLNLSFRQEFSSVFTVPFNLNFGYDQYFGSSRFWASIKRVGRAPNYDDLFFIPGGNPELKPEKGWSYEVGYELRPSVKESISINVYRNEMKDWIQWRPVDTLFNFSPTNFTEVHVNGLRIDYKGAYPNGNITLITQSALTLQRTQNLTPLVNNDKEIELLLSPNVVLNTTIGIREGRSTFGYRSRFLGEQFSDEFNTEKLPSSFVHDLFFMTFFADRFRLNIRVNNITNLTYFTTTAYPMYGRNFGIDLIYRSKASEDKKERTKAKTKRRRGRRW
ncbi:MAG: TonB-dependent receptor [Bacteroidota bacterium]